MGATRLASGFLRQRLTDKRVISAVCEPLLLVYESFPQCPTRDASPPLELAFSGSVLCLRLVLAGPLPYYKSFTYSVSYILH